MENGARKMTPWYALATIDCASTHIIEQEETLEIEYIESILPPQKMSDLPHDDWVSSVSCQLQGWVSVSPVLE